MAKKRPLAARLGGAEAAPSLTARLGPSKIADPPRPTKKNKPDAPAKAPPPPAKAAVPPAKKSPAAPVAAPAKAAAGSASGKAASPAVPVGEVKVLSFAELMAQKRAAQAAAASEAASAAAPSFGSLAVSVEDAEAEVEAALLGDGSSAEGEPAAVGTPRGVLAAAGAGGTFVVGQRVLGEFGDGEEWFPGAISAGPHADGTYDIAYDDGDAEEHKNSARIVDGTILEE